MGRGRAAHSRSSIALELALALSFLPHALARRPYCVRHGCLHGAPSSHASGLPLPKSAAAPPFSPRAAHDAPLFLASSPLQTATARAAITTNCRLRGRLALGHCEARQGHHWVPLVLGMLRHHRSSPMPPLAAGTAAAPPSPPIAALATCGQGHAAVGCSWTSCAPAQVRTWPGMAMLLPLIAGTAPAGQRNRPDAFSPTPLLCVSKKPTPLLSLSLCVCLTSRLG
jgi:hypothetical protein